MLGAPRGIATAAASIASHGAPLAISCFDEILCVANFSTGRLRQTRPLRYCIDRCTDQPRRRVPVALA